MGTGEGATAAAGQSGGVGDAGGPATSLTNTNAQIVTNGSTDGIVSASNKATANVVGNAIANSQGNANVGPPAGFPSFAQTQSPSSTYPVLLVV